MLRRLEHALWGGVVCGVAWRCMALRGVVHSDYIVHGDRELIWRKQIIGLHNQARPEGCFENEGGMLGWLSSILVLMLFEGKHNTRLTLMLKCVLTFPGTDSSSHRTLASACV